MISVWTLVVDDGEATVISVHPTEEAALFWLRDNYPTLDDDLADVPDDDLLQHLIDRRGFVIYLDSADLPWLEPPL